MQFRFKILYKVHNVESVSEDHRFGGISFEAGNIPNITNNDTPELYPHHWDMDFFKSWISEFKSPENAIIQLSDYKFIGVELLIENPQP